MAFLATTKIAPFLLPMFSLLLLATPCTAILRIASDIMTLEHTPAHIAIQDFYPGSAEIIEGGIATLLRSWSSSSSPSSEEEQVHLGTNAEIPSLKSYYDNRNLRIIYTMTETYYRIVARHSANISTLSDLAGKKIGTIPTTTAAYFVEKYLSTVGLSLGDGDYELAYGGMCLQSPCSARSLPSLLVEGSVDAIALWEPTPQFAVRLLAEDDDVVVFHNPEVYREIVNLHTTTEVLGNATLRKEVVEFVRAVNRAQRLFREEAGDGLFGRVAEVVGTETGVVGEVWDLHGWRGELVGDVVERLVEEEGWVAEVQGREVMGDGVVGGLVDWSVVEEAREGQEEWWSTGVYVGPGGG